MSNVARVLGSAGNTQGIPLKSENIFNTSVWTGTGASRTITNNVNLSGEGGLTWIKARSGSSSQHALFDTERGVLKGLASSSTAAEADEANSVSAFNTNGFDLGSWSGVNGGSTEYVGWTFRKAPKFFDIVTYTGTGSSLTIDHNLGVEPAVIIIKRTNTTSDWIVFTDVVDGSMDYLYLNRTDASANGSTLLSKSSTSFTLLQSFTTGNSSGSEYVAYLFAHNDGDGDFGPTGDQDIIKCGSYTEVNGADVRVDLGFEPQWIMIKVTNTTGGWGMYDVMRGWTSGSDDFALGAHSANAESNVGDRWLIHPDGFTWKNTGNARNIMYMAIRRGGMDAPTSATDVFAIDTADGTPLPTHKSGFVTDMLLRRINKNTTNSFDIATRLTQKRRMFPGLTNQESAITNYSFDYMNGAYDITGTDATDIAYMWKRAHSYFDVVTYTGTGSARTQSHNLGVVPEMMWVRVRNLGENWAVYHKDVGATKYLQTNSNNAAATSSTRWNDTTPTSSVFSLGADNEVNASGGYTYIAYLFATVAGVSKVGSYTMQSGGTDVDCGFSAGARFILIKSTGSGRDWLVFDTTRGIVSGNDPYLLLNDTNAEVTSQNLVNPLSSGFTVRESGVGNVANVGETYIFYAIA